MFERLCNSVSLVPGLLVLACITTSASADTITICWDGSGDYLTIQEGIDAAVDGDEVVVCDGVFTGFGNKNLDFGGKAITVRSVNGPDDCIIDCENDGRGFYFHNDEGHDSVVDGFTITNGSTWGCGGIYCSGAGPTIVDCTITENSVSGNAGGIGCFGGNPIIDHCTISANSAVYGGAIDCELTNATITGCTIVNNTAEDVGGAIVIWSGTVLIEDCILAGNTSMHHDGGAVWSHGSVTIRGCTLDGNSAHSGGGVRAEQSGITVVNTTISANTATYEGGGLRLGPGDDDFVITGCAITDNAAYRGGGIAADGPATVIGCTVTRNTAEPSEAGGIRCRGGFPILANCIFWGNALPDVDVEYGTAMVAYSNVHGGWPGYGNIDADPLFVDADDGDFHLGAGSPCIDAGCNWAVPADVADLDDDGDVDEFTPFDLDGEGRFFDDPDTPDTGHGCPPIVDMGAYEFGGTGPQPCLGDLDCDRTVGESDLAILLAAWGDSVDGDMTCDGVTNQADLGILLAAWGTRCP